MRVRGVLGSVVAVVVLSVAACAGDEPVPPATSTASTSSTEPTSLPTSSTPDVPVPELPDAATVGDAAGAEAFVKHWVDVLNYAYQTGDTKQLTSISESGCETCADLADVIEQRNDEGQRLEGGLAVVSLVRSPPPENGLVSVSAQLAQEEGRLVSGNGDVEVLPADPPANLGFVVAFEDGNWMLAGIGTE